MRRSRAFTLIELLVVVAILSLLLAILLPSLKAAREQAKQTLCLTNLKSMGDATQLYAQQNRDTLVRAESERMHFVASLLPGLGQPENVERLWNRDTGAPDSDALLDVCQKTRVLQCPTFPKPEQALDYVVSAFQLPFNKTASDTISSTTGTGPQSTFTRKASYFYKVEKILPRSPADFIYITEAHQNHPVPGKSDWAELTDLFLPDHVPFGGAPRVANDERHPGGIGSLFFDGHSRVYSPRRIDPGPPGAVLDRIARFTYDIDGK